MSNKIQLIKRLREVTGMGLVEAKNAAEEAELDYEKALTILKSRGTIRVKPNRTTHQGRIEVYNHNGRIGVLVEILCETDFVARTNGFKELCREVAMQVASMNPLSVDELLAQEYVRDSKKKVAELVKDFAIECGENIRISRFDRFELNGTDKDV